MLLCTVQDKELVHNLRDHRKLELPVLKSEGYLLDVSDEDVLIIGGDYAGLRPYDRYKPAVSLHGGVGDDLTPRLCVLALRHDFPA